MSGTLLTTADKTLLRLMLVLACVTPAFAQDARVPSAEEIIRRLTPQLNLTPENLRNNAVSVEGKRRSQSQTVQQPGSIDLQVNFEYASARLSADARIVLDNLGQALADPALRGSRFRVAGHTDARGGDAYNLNLSRQRARSVADYLMSQHRIAAQRLSIEGYGRSQLIDRDHPESAVNRRVQITNLGS